MSKLTDSKYYEELEEDELEQVTGGKFLDLVGGTYSVTCPFCNSGKPFTKTLTAQDMIRSNVTVGSCECGAYVYFKSASKALFRNKDKSMEAVITRNRL